MAMNSFYAEFGDNFKTDYSLDSSGFYIPSLEAKIKII